MNAVHQIHQLSHNHTFCEKGGQEGRGSYKHYRVHYHGVKCGQMVHTTQILLMGVCEFPRGEILTVPSHHPRLYMVLSTEPNEENY